MTEGVLDTLPCSEKASQRKNFQGSPYRAPEGVQVGAPRKTFRGPSVTLSGALRAHSVGGRGLVMCSEAVNQGIRGILKKSYVQRKILLDK